MVEEGGTTAWVEEGMVVVGMVGVVVCMEEVAWAAAPLAGEE